MRGRRSGERSRSWRRRKRQANLCGARAVSLVSSPPGRLRDPSWGHYDPCARCSLTDRSDRRDTQARSGAEAKAERLLPRAAAGRREAQPAGDPAGHLRRPGDGSDREADHGCGVPHQRLSALCPLIFSEGSRKKTRGTRPSPTGWRSVGSPPSFRGEGEAREPGIHNRGTGEWNTDRATRTGSWLWIPGPALPRRPGMTARESA